MSRTAILTLTTDFGASSPYVAEMKGVILTIAPGTQIVDISHTVPPQAIRYGAITLFDVAPCFPSPSIHIAVIDPGVGTDRSIVAAEIDQRVYVCPDNGLLDLLISQRTVTRAVRLSQRDFWAPRVSATFHGRDIMAPVAAHLANGVPLEEFGTAITLHPRLAWPQPEIGEGRIDGEVLMADSFGNLITNIHREMVARAGLDVRNCRIMVGDRDIGACVTTYGHVPAGSLVALFGSHDRLEIAESMGSASRALEWSPDRPALSVRIRAA